MTDFSEVYELYFKDVYRYLFSLCQNSALAEEITQETFFKALKNINRFNGKCHIRVWLCQIAKNTYFTYAQHEKRSLPESEAPETASADDLEKQLADRDAAKAIHKSLHGMEEPYKEVFTLRIFGELSFKEIAELFGRTESWARVTFHRAKAKIKEDVE